MKTIAAIPKLSPEHLPQRDQLSRFPGGLTLFVLKLRTSDMMSLILTQNSDTILQNQKIIKRL